MLETVCVEIYLQLEQLESEALSVTAENKILVNNIVQHSLFWGRITQTESTLIQPIF